MTVIEIIKNAPGNAKLDAILSRTPDFSAAQEATAREIVTAVKEHGDRALLAYTKNLTALT